MTRIENSNEWRRNKKWRKTVSDILWFPEAKVENIDIRS